MSRPQGRGIAIGEGNYGIASTGDRATLVQVQVTAGAAEIHDVRDLQPRELPLLAALAEDDLVGRDKIINQAAKSLAAGVSVQLHGAPGTGRKAIARAAIRQLAGRRACGVALLPADEPHTLESLYQRLATAFFGVIVPSPPEEILAAAAGQLTGLIYIGDCDLPPGEVTRLLATFPGCTFLLTSQHPAADRAGTAIEVSPLPQRSAIELLAQETGDRPAGLARLRLEQACRLANGQPQRLLQYGAFIASATRSGHPLHTLVPPQEAAAILAAGLSEPARQALVALATFGGELAPEHLTAISGLPHGPETWSVVLQVAPELLSARLVTLTSTGYRITPDAAAAVRARHWEPARPDIAAHGLLPFLTANRIASAPPSSAPPASIPPSSALLLGIARGLVDAGQNELASRFIRTAAPAALAAGQIRAWTQLLALGIPAALAAGTEADLQYFLQEEHTRAQLHGDKAALAALLTMHGQLPHSQPPPAPRPPTLRRIRPHLPSRARAILTAHHHAATITTAAITTAAIITAAILIAQPATTNSPQAAAEGFYHSYIAEDWTVMCAHIVPSLQASCQTVFGSIDATRITGQVTVGNVVTSGNQALVSVTGRICPYHRSGRCKVNANPGFGMPASPSQFANDYLRAVDVFYWNVENPSVPLSPVPCAEVGGTWYVSVIW